MSTDSWIDLVIAGSALLVLTLAAVVELSISVANRMTLREWIEGQTASQRAESLADHPQTIRANMLLVELMTGLLVAVMLTRFFLREMPAYGVPLAVVVSSVAVVVASRVVPVFFVSNDYGDETPRLVRIGTVLSYLVWPITVVTENVARLLQSFARRNGNHVADAEVAGDERAEGMNGVFAFEEDEEEMISGVLGLEEATAREIMVPRLDIVAVPDDMPITEVVDVIRAAGHSRIPVYRESIDTIIGIIYAKDLLRFVRDEPAGVKLPDLLRPGYFVPESKHIDELLRDMRQAKVHIAIVVDEYGGTAGLVTIEDILEEIVGEIQDEYDRETPLVERVGAEEIIVDGRIGVDEIAEIFEADFAEGETGTIGGFVQKRLGRIPSAGESVRADGFLIEVQSVEHHRVRKLRVLRVSDGGEANAPAEAGVA